MFDVRLVDVGRSDLTTKRAEYLFILPIASATTVGAFVAVMRPAHPVGWLFLAFGLSLAASGVADGYAAYAAVARPGSLPGAGVVAVISDKAFVPWLLLLALILLLTPTGTFLSPRWRHAAYVAAASALFAFGLALLLPYEGEYASLGIVSNPWEIHALQEPADAVRLAAIVVLHLVVVAAAGSMVLRFRAAEEEERRQLSWLALAAVPFPVLVVGAFIAASLGQDFLLILLGAGFLTVIPVAAGLAVAQHGLYDVNGMLRRAFTYGALSALVVGSYALAVVFVGSVVGSVVGGAVDSSQIAAVVATLAVVSIAAPARGRIQDWIDRRFSRRQFEALAMLRRWLRDPSPVMSLESALREATGDNGLRVGYWIDGRDRWVDESGAAVTPEPDGVTVTRRGNAIAAVNFNERNVERSTVEALLADAASELENVRLRASLALKLIEVRESRERIIEAQELERRRLERNLHDGAQQRLLAITLQLRAAEMNGNSERARVVLHAAAEELQLAVKELRDLANGLAPATLSGEGLESAFGELASRTPVPVRVDVTRERFPPLVEETAWFITCEAVTNAVKHASPRSVAISAQREDGYLRLVVEDDGIGGADPGGTGLLGIAARAEAIGGRLSVSERRGAGTVVAAELPCG